MRWRFPKDVAPGTVRCHAGQSCRNQVDNHSGRHSSPPWLEGHYILSWTRARAVEPKRQSRFSGRGDGEHHEKAQADEDVRSHDCSHGGNSYTAGTLLVPLTNATHREKRASPAHTHSSLTVPRAATSMGLPAFRRAPRR